MECGKFLFMLFSSISRVLLAIFIFSSNVIKFSILFLISSSKLNKKLKTQLLKNQNTKKYAEKLSIFFSWYN
jgi:hypothetical protein